MRIVFGLASAIFVVIGWLQKRESDDVVGARKAGRRPRATAPASFAPSKGGRFA
jgi:hypothetical protein